MNMKRTLQVTLAIVGAIPFALGVLQLANGAGMFLPADAVNPQIDSHVRFGAVWFMVASFISWWMIPRIEQHGNLFRIVFLTMAGAGLARLLSMYLVGMPEPQVLGAAIFEILLVGLIPWQAIVARKYNHVVEV